MNYQVVSLAQIKPTYYVPSTRDISTIIAGLNGMSNQQIAFPGNWSPQLWVSDLFVYPCLSKQHIQTALISSLIEPNKWSYLRFFNETRGFNRPNIVNENIWNLFERGSLMLAFESIFLKLINFTTVNQSNIQLISNGGHASTDPRDQIILTILNELSNISIYVWNSFLKSKNYVFTWQELADDPYTALTKQSSKINTSSSKDEQSNSNKQGAKIRSTYKPAGKI
jgi:hypothetical protein